MGKNHQPEVRDDGSSTDTSDEKSSPSAAARCCQHVKKSVDSTKLRKLLKTTGLLLECSQCQKLAATSPASEVSESPDSPGGFEYDNTLWLCLKCGTQLCGRSKHQHALLHHKTPHSDSHALTMNTRSFEIWCYECDNEVKPDSRKNLLECVEFVKGLGKKPPVAVPVDNIENKIIATFEALRPLVSADELNKTTMIEPTAAIPMPPPPPPQPGLPIPGMAKRINEPLISYGSYGNKPSNIINTTGNILGAKNNINNGLASTNGGVGLEPLPRVRGLTNLGNTCFFNAVMQCLAQTPYLLEVLKELGESGEEFTLPGGTFKVKDEEVLELPPIKGSLSAWGGLTAALAQTLEELQSGGGVFNPNKLFSKLCAKCPQFQGGDQHDSHELLRHLLESVRSEDLKRYQRVILESLGCKGQDHNSVSEEMKLKCKIYGNQAAERILRPEQVFRGFLVSTLTCQDCYNVSSRHEYFLDMSLPVSVEKSPPQMRRKTSPDNSNNFFLHPATSTSQSNNFNNTTTSPTKPLSKKEQRKERKARRAAVDQNNKIVTKKSLEDIGASGDTIINNLNNCSPTTNAIGCATQEEANINSAISSASSSSAEQSDADVEDNLIDDNEKNCRKPLNTPNSLPCDTNGNSQTMITSPAEKRDDSPENMDKDSLDEDENDSGIATSPANAGSSFPTSTSNSETNGDNTNTETTATNSFFSMGLSQKGVNVVRQLTLNEIPTTFETNTADSSAATLTNGELKPVVGGNEATNDTTQLLEQLKVNNNEQQKEEHAKKEARAKARRVRTQSYSDWSTTIAPRYQCEDGECSVQSCLNNFTAIELMTGNNKVGCEACTKHMNGEDPKAKTVYTNATKQFLISSPPAVLILHLKRFQLGPRCIFRKLAGHVNFPMILDIAPFCGSKVKNLPNIDRKQKKLLYALYGVVEHSGGMYGGHYTAYVKVRSKLSNEDKRWKFLPQGSKAELDQDDEQRKKLEELLAREKARDLRMKAANDSDDFSSSDASNASNSSLSPTLSDQEEAAASSSAKTANDTAGAAGGHEEAAHIQMPMGKWYYVSDSRVTDASEREVLSAQAYLLFYERIY